MICVCVRCGLRASRYTSGPCAHALYWAVLYKLAKPIAVSYRVIKCLPNPMTFRKKGERLTERDGQLYRTEGKQGETPQEAYCKTEL